jgi:hypothetical protein
MFLKGILVLLKSPYIQLLGYCTAGISGIILGVHSSVPIFVISIGGG